MFETVSFKSVIGDFARGLHVALAMVALSCGARVEEQPQESNTNWLKACDTSMQCGDDMACECGVCTQVCDEVACPSRLTCVAEAECSGRAASCQATCESDSDCDFLVPNMRCDDGVCVDAVGLTLNQVSSGVRPGGSVDPSTSDGTTCRYAYVEYSVGSRISRDDCGATTCTCGSDGEWVDCGGVDIECRWAAAVRPCSEMFPGVALDDLPSDPVTIEAASIEGTALSLSVSFSGGCKQHDLVLCFAPGGESYPVFIDLKLIHDGHDDTCDDTLVPELSFDLGPVVGYYSEAYQSDGDIIRTPFGVFGFGELSCEMRETAASLELSQVPVYDAACEDDEDCVIANNSNSCHDGCGVVTSNEMAEVLRAKIEAVNSNFCASYESQCGPVLALPCSPRSGAICSAGKCTEQN